MKRSAFLLAASLVASCTNEASGPSLGTPPGGDDASPPVPGDAQSPEPAPDESEPNVNIPNTSENAMALVARDLNHFAVDFWSQAAGGDGNVVLSPLSVAVALAMVEAGAKGETADEIRRALHVDDANQEDVYAALASMVSHWNERQEDLELRVVDRLFGDRSVAWNQEYLARTKAVFGAPLEPVDFRSASESVRDRINTWVEEQTRDRIADLLPQGAVDASTRLVLVNAIYFKAPWAEPFIESSTKNEPFHAAGGTRPVAMMRREDRMRYAEHPGDRLKVVELPYRGGRFAMVVILPDDRQGLAAVEKKLDASHLAKWTNDLGHTKVDLRMPKFKIEMPAGLRLSGILKSLGITAAFDARRADFSGMAPAGSGLEISEGFHKAFIAVDEKGTEAAAATAVGMRVTSAPLPTEPKLFVADHPFLYLVRDTSNGAILFMGRVADPKFE